MPYHLYNIRFVAPAEGEFETREGRKEDEILVDGSHRHTLKRAGAPDITVTLAHNDEENDTFPNLIIRYGP